VAISTGGRPNLGKRKENGPALKRIVLDLRWEGRQEGGVGGERDDADDHRRGGKENGWVSATQNMLLTPQKQKGKKT